MYHDQQLEQSLININRKANRSALTYARTIDQKVERAIDINRRMHETTERALKYQEDAERKRKSDFYMKMVGDVEKLNRMD
jgi:hypothetical protein